MVWINLLSQFCKLPVGSMDYAVTNVAARYCMENVADVRAGQDAGLAVSSNGGIFMFQAANGFGFLRPAANQVSIGVRANGVLATTNITPAGWDETRLNEYRLIFTSATATTNANVVVLLNGIPRASFTWTPANLNVTMPALDATSLPMVPGCYWNQNGNCLIAADGGLSIDSAPTAANTY